MNRVAFFSIFVHFLAYLKTQFAAHVKILQSDGGGKYISGQFQQFLRGQGIIHQKSLPIYSRTEWLN